MTAQRVAYVGWSVTDDYLSVTFTLGETGARRLYQTKVPMASLAAAKGFLDTIDRNVARQLRDAWQEDEPLVLVGGAECPPWPHEPDECEGCQSERQTDSSH